MPNSALFSLRRISKINIYIYAGCSLNHRCLLLKQAQIQYCVHLTGVGGRFVLIVSYSAQGDHYSLLNLRRLHALPMPRGSFGPPHNICLPLLYPRGLLQLFTAASPFILLCFGSKDIGCVLIIAANLRLDYGIVKG